MSRLEYEKKNTFVNADEIGILEGDPSKATTNASLLNAYLSTSDKPCIVFKKDAITKLKGGI